LGILDTSTSKQRAAKGFEMDVIFLEVNSGSILADKSLLALYCDHCNLSLQYTWLVVGGQD